VRIYPDTVLWNELCDQDVSSKDLVSELGAAGVQLALGTQVVYEIAKTFQMRGPLAADRGRKLFCYLKQFVDMRIPCVKMISDILGEEMRRASRQTENVRTLLDEANFSGLANEVEKLAAGNFDYRASRFVSDRKDHANQTRSDVAEHFKARPKLKKILAAVSVDELASWMEKEVGRSGRRILRQHIAWTFPQTSLREATWLAKKLLASPSYRMAHAIARADLYINWRYAQVDSISRDVPDDLFHVVNAAYCDVYATKERRQGRYAALVLTGTSVAIYDGVPPLQEWLRTMMR
jgi:hypothetical protein